MPKPIATIVLIAVLIGALSLIAALTTGATRVVLMVVAVPLITAFGGPLIVGRIHRKPRQLRLPDGATARF